MCTIDRVRFLNLLKRKRGEKSKKPKNDYEFLIVKKKLHGKIFCAIQNTRKSYFFSRNMFQTLKNSTKTS